MPYAQSGPLKIYYEVYGEGPALVFAHGGNGNTLSWFNQMPVFTRHYRCVLVDLRGFKNSPCTLEQYHVREFVPDALAVLDHAGVQRAGYVCQSLGAWVGLPMAVHHRERVGCLVINSSPTPAYSARNWEVLKRSGNVSKRSQTGEVSRTLDMGMSERFARERPEIAFLFDSITRLNGPRRTETMWDDPILPAQFAGYCTPTLVMGGACDNFLTPDHHLHIATLIPGAETHTFADCGHYSYVENPGEYNEVIEAFLRRYPW